MKNHLFMGAVKNCGSMTTPIPEEIFPQETMIFSCAPDFSRSYGGPITAAVLDDLMSRGFLDEMLDLCESKSLYPIIDTRVHMLMPGQYPAIPGWHCDNFPRTNYHAQPDPQKVDKDLFHFTFVVSTHADGVSNPRFVNQQVYLPYDPANVWKSVHNEVEARDLKIIIQGDGELLRFSQETIHTASPCVNRGWRYFFRMSPMELPPKNLIRKQVQVYSTTDGGW